MQADLPQDLPETPEADPTIDTTPTEADSFDFGSLLSEALAYRDETRRIKEGRKAVRTRAMIPGTDLKDLLEEVQRMEAKREWRPRADVMMFQIQHCTYCDNYSPLFTGLFQRQAHVREQHSMRWIAATAQDNMGLKREVKTTEIDVPVCHFCISEQGYPGEQLGIVFDAEPVEALEEEEVAEGLTDEDFSSTTEQLELNLEPEGV